MADFVELGSFDELPAVFGQMGRSYNGADYTPVMRKTIKRFGVLHAGYFRGQADPLGRGWTPLAPATVRRKGHDRILVDTGRLRASLSGGESGGGDRVREISPDRGRGMLFGTTVPYSGIHQAGGGNLPQRMHVGVDESEVDALANAVADQVVAALLEGFK